MKKFIILFIATILFSSCYDTENYIPVYSGYSGYTQCREIKYYSAIDDSFIGSSSTGDSIFYARIHYYKLKSLFLIYNGSDSCLTFSEYYIVNYLDTPYTIKFSSLSSNSYSVWVLDTIPFNPEFYNLSCN